MRSRSGVLAASGIVVLALALAFGLTRAAPRPTPQEPARRMAAPAAVPSPAATPAADPRRLRDVFRFADEPAVRRGAEPPAPPVEVVRAARATPPSGPRLVGLLRRSGVLVAVLSLDGEVELAAAGQPAAGVTVLSVGEDGVRVRRADGSEETLTLSE